MNGENKIINNDTNSSIEKTRKLDFSIGSFIISIIIIFNFITPTAIVPRSVFITVFSLIPFLILLTKHQLEKKSILFLTILFLTIFISGTFQNFLNLYYLFLFQLLIYEYKDGIFVDRRNKILLFIGCLSIIVQIFYYSKTYIIEDGRTGFGTDPNFSGLLILLFFFYFRKINSYIVFIPIIIAIFFFQSRTLFLSIILFLSLEFLSKTTLNKFLYKILNPFRVIILSNIVIVLFSAIIIAGFAFQKNETSSITDRMFNFTDRSNSGRLTANVFWSSKVIFGEYLFKSENLEEKNFDTDTMIMPHNSLLNLLISSSTIFGIIYLLYISYLLKPLINAGNIEYFYSFLFFSLFLHGLFNSIYLFPFLMTFLLNPQTNNNQNSRLSFSWIINRNKYL